jgi:uncharacterized membrane protein
VHRKYGRDTVEFGRVLAFSDGLYAIAMTLLIVSVGVPNVADKESVGDLADALDDLQPEFVSFFISFAVIGRYWVAHHQFVSLLATIDRSFVWLNLTYLMFVAFLPFPTSLLGDYIDNPLSVALYATNVAVVSGMEVVLFRHAQRAGLLQRPLPANVYRYGVTVSLSPVLFFIASIPIAFASTSLAIVTWFLVVPFGVLSNRWKPEGTDELLSG